MLSLYEVRWSLLSLGILARLNLMPFLVDRQTGTIRLQTNRIPRNAFKCSYIILLVYFTFMVERLVQSIIYRESMKILHLPFHGQMIVATMLPLYIATSLFVVNPEITVAIFNEMYDGIGSQKVPFAWKMYSLSDLFAIFTPFVISNIVSMYITDFIVEPNKMFYFYSVVGPFVEYNANLRKILMGLEICLLLNVISPYVINTFVMLSTFSRVFTNIERQIHLLQIRQRSISVLDDATQVCRRLQIFVELYNHNFAYIAFCVKVLCSYCCIVCAFFAIKFMNSHLILAMANLVLTMNGFSAYVIFYDKAFKIPVRWSLLSLDILARLNLMPFLVDRQTGKIRLQTNRIRRNTFKCSYTLLLAYFTFMVGRLVQSMIYRVSMNILHLPFHGQMIVATILPVYVATSLYVVNPEITVAIFNEMYDGIGTQKVPFTWKMYSLSDLFAIFIPLVISNIVSMYITDFIVEPNKMFYFYSVVGPFIEYNANLLKIFMGLEICLLLNAISPYVISGFVMLSAFSRVFNNIERHIKLLQAQQRNVNTLNDATQVCRRLQIFVELYNHNFAYIAFYTKVLCSYCCIVCTFFAIKFMNSHLILATANLVLTMNGFSAYVIFYDKAFKIPGKLEELKTLILMGSKRLENKRGVNLRRRILRSIPNLIAFLSVIAAVHSAAVPNDRGDVVFVGDSITDWWRNDGRSVWDQYYENLGAVNVGVAGDVTQQTIDRINGGSLDGFNTRVVVLLIGTNDLGRGITEEIVYFQIGAILSLIQTKQPNANILLLGILPRGGEDIHRKIRTVNDRVRNYDNGRTIRYLNMEAQFSPGLGQVYQNLYWGDQLHLSTEGYQVWARTMADLFNQLYSR
ncbi:unnamed protein product [Allacma fusca]|uniref:SGNH hydrolase-type esterase domain-containing protein n=1 Tax=Allacma fusca TaxID=39272 RepID=A0A8J2L418_9HEXA|nr:unnamed protein product [Allacma fusca]